MVPKNDFNTDSQNLKCATRGKMMMGMLRAQSREKGKAMDASVVELHVHVQSGGVGACC